MTLVSLAAELFYAGVLDADQFPNVEIVSFQPAGEDARSVYAHLSFDQQQSEQDTVSRRTERMRVRVGRDESHEKGGIESAVRGDMLRRANDPEWYPPFAFTGEITEQTNWSWVLMFERPVPTGLGKRQSR